MDPGRLVDRAWELRLLEDLWRRGSPGLVVVYGRRRVGKTRLLIEWLRGRRHAYYQAGLWSHEQNLRGLASALEEQLGVPGASGFTGDLRSLLRVAAAVLGGQRAAIVIDEVTYWLRVAPGVASDLQWVVDHVLAGTRLLIVLSGSLVGVVERDLLGGGAPLYGRASARLRLGSLEPWCLPFFAPRLGPADLVRLHALLGGVPYYLRLVGASEEPLAALLRLFGPQGLLQDEPLFLLRDEFRDPHPYLSLLRALAGPRPRRLAAAAQEAGMPLSHATRYAGVLSALGLVERETPLWARRSLYRVADSVLNAWLYLVEPLWGRLAEDPEAALPEARRRAEELAAAAWEQLAALHARTVLARRLGLRVDEAGRLIHRGEEVDYVVVDHGSETILAIEAKWSDLDAAGAKRTLNKLEARLHAALPARLRGYHVVASLYARSIEAEPTGSMHVVTPDDMPWRSGCPEAAPAGRVG